MCTVQGVRNRVVAVNDQAAGSVLYVGDAIIEINGVNMEGKTHEQVVKALRDAGDAVGLVLTRRVQNASKILLHPNQIY